MVTIKVTRKENYGAITEYYKKVNKVIAYIDFPYGHRTKYSAVSVIHRNSGIGSEHADYESAKKCIFRYIDGLYFGNVQII